MFLLRNDIGRGGVNDIFALTFKGKLTCLVRVEQRMQFSRRQTCPRTLRALAMSSNADSGDMRSAWPMCFVDRGPQPQASHNLYHFYGSLRQSSKVQVGGEGRKRQDLVDILLCEIRQLPDSPVLH